MQYSLEKVSTTAACDTLLVFAQKEKLDLERKRRNLGEAIEAVRERVDLIGKEYVQVQSLLEAYTAAYHSLPEGSKDKVSMHVDVKCLEVRRAVLDKKSFMCNERTVLAKEVQYNRLGSQVLAMEIFIMAVQRRRAVLFQPARVTHVAPLCAPAARQKTQPVKGRKQGHFPTLPAVHPKQQFKKSVYSFPAHFSVPRDCTWKTVSLQKHVQFSSA